MPFYDPAQVPPKELAPGVTLRVVWGEKVMLSLVEMKPGSVVQLHTHPHEQAGIVLEGEFEFQIGREKRLLKKGDIYFVPSGVEHGAPRVPVLARALDVFSPPREEYKR